MEHYKQTFNFIGAMCLKCALHLTIPEKISNHGKPITVTQLLSAIHLHPSKANGLTQLMRYLVYMGLFSKTKVDEDDDAYLLSPSSNLILSEAENTIATANSSAPLVLGPAHAMPLKAWQNLGDWFLREELISPFESANGIGFWDYVKNNPDGRFFNESMESDSKMFIQFVLKGCFPAFERLDSLVDVGGGTGALAKAIAEEFPDLKCTVFDLPNVVEALQSHGNLDYVGGDMFQSVPPADAILMKSVLHDWTDEDCILILKNCKAAISEKGKEGKEGKVILIEIVVNEESDKKELSEVKLIYDMTMRVCFNAKERTEKEWQNLFLNAGFTHFTITPLLGFRSLIEVFP